jgi:DNA repair protein RecO (recombination protein O)
MIEWQDNGIVLSVRPYGESSAIVTVLTMNNGRYAGLVRSVNSANARAALQPGNLVAVIWRARLADHLGSFKVELLTSYAAGFFDDPLKLAGLSAVLSVCEQALPEREPLAPVYEGLLVLLDHISCQDEQIWLAAYIQWEIGFLAELGFSLELLQCAVTGDLEDLTYVSPKTGRAVSKAAGFNYRLKLLSLPSFLTSRGFIDAIEFIDGLKLTGYFLASHVFAPYNKPTPPARNRFEERVLKKYSL